MSEPQRERWDKFRRRQNAKKPSYQVGIAEWKDEHPSDAVQASSTEVKQGQMLKELVCEKLAKQMADERQPNRRKAPRVRACQNAQEMVRSSSLRVMQRSKWKAGVDVCKCEMSFRFGGYGFKSLRVLLDGLDASGSSRKGLWTLQFEVECSNALFRNDKPRH